MRPMFTFDIRVLVVSLALVAGCVDAGAEVDKRRDVNLGYIGRERPADWVSTEVRDAESDLVADLEVGDGVGEGVGDVGPELALPDLMDSMDLVDLTEAGDLPGDACVPQCDGLECGPDMCGGSCGLCPEGDVCDFGICKSCKPDCEGKECGTDGCGGLCGECPSKFACVGGACKAPPCQEDATLYFENFDSCTQGDFQIADAQPDDNVTWWALPLKHNSPPCALYLGDPDSMTYDTGMTVTVALTSPLITFPPDNAWRLTFSLFLEAEPVPAPQYPYDFDVLFLYFEPQDAGTRELIWSSKQILNSTDAEMIPVAIDVSAFAGLAGRFIFEFDTVDSTANEFPGAFLDDFGVDNICPYCTGDDQCDDLDGCTVHTCTPFSNFPTIGTCTYAALDGCCLNEPEAFCDDGDACTDDACDLDSALCTHVPIPDCVPEEPDNG